MREIKDTRYFPNFIDARAYVESVMIDPSHFRVWYTDRHWMKDDPQRYEVVVEWIE